MDANAFTLGGGDLAIIIIVLSLFLIIAILAFRDRITFKMGSRNILRRKGNTAIVISGLMIGTMIITSSFVVGDTLQNMIEHVILDGAGNVDFSLGGQTEAGQDIIIDEANLTTMEEEIWSFNDDGRGKLIDGVTGELLETTYVKDIRTNLAEPRSTLVGYNITSSPDMGGLYIDGKEVEWDLPPGDVYVNRALADSIDISTGDMLALLVYPGIDTPYGHNTFSVRGILDDRGRAKFNLGRNIFLPVEHVQAMYDIDGVSTIFVSNQGTYDTGRQNSPAVRERLNSLLGNDTTNPFGIEIGFDKEQDIKDVKESTKEFTNIFLVLGTFSIIAGILLVVNIFVMLGEERKAELGISRAVGMKRRQLAKMFMFEGVIYSAISSAIGVAFGVTIAYIIMRFINSIFQGISDMPFEISKYFEFTPFSLLIGFLMGFLITTATVLGISWRISRLNIVRAIRNIPEPPMSKKHRGLMLLGVGMVLLGILFLPSAYILDITNVHIHLIFFTLYEKYSLALATSGLSLSLLGLGMLLRRFLGDRISFTSTCTILLIFWLIPISKLPYNPFPWKGDMEMFVLSGVFMVTSAIIILMFNNQLLLRAMLALFGLFRLRTAPIKTAISYPMKNKFRTGMTVFMFALVIFTITTLSMMTGIFGYSIDQIVEEQSGGTEIVGYSMEQNALFYRHTEMWTIMDEGGIDSSGVRAVHTLGSSSCVVQLPSGLLGPFLPAIVAGMADNSGGGGQGEAPDISTLTEMMGNNSHDTLLPWNYLTVDDGFVEAGGLPLTGIDPAYSSDDEVWGALAANSSVVVVDNSMNLMIDQLVSSGMASPSTPRIEPGMTFNISFDGIEMNSYRIIGITDQTSITGIFFHSSMAPEPSEELTFLFETEAAHGSGAVRTLANELETGLNMSTELLDEGNGGSASLLATAGRDNPYFRSTYSIMEVIDRSGNVSRDWFNNIFELTSSQAMVNFSQSATPNPMSGEYMDMPYTVIGCDENFITNNRYQFSNYDHTLFSSPSEVWEGVNTNSSLVVLDGAWSGDFGPDKSGGEVGVGSILNLSLGNGESHLVRVAGVLKEFFIQGLFMNRAFVDEVFAPPIPTVFVFDVADGYDPDDVGKAVESNLGMETIVIRTLIDQFVNVMNMFFSLFQAFLGLGLIVGIAGLGMITLRAVHERRQEIGMMRAIGFKKRGIMASFLIEASFVALVGIFIGTALGIALGWNMWVENLSHENMRFYIAWSKILIVALIAYGATAIFTIPPSYAASQVAPAEALRYE